MAEKLALAEGTFTACFGCGDDNAFGLKLAFERDGDAIRSRAVLGKQFAGYPDFAHGGIVATMLDEAMGWAMLNLAGRHGVTKTMNVTYRRPVPLDRPLVLSAAVLIRHERTVVLEAKVEDERGRLLARAEGEWAVVRDERAGG